MLYKVLFDPHCFLCTADHEYFSPTVSFNKDYKILKHLSKVCSWICAFIVRGSGFACAGLCRLPCTCFTPSCLEGSQLEPKSVVYEPVQ